MKKARLYICAVIFITLTVIRFTFPALGDKIADEIAQVLRYENEQTVAVMRIGRELVDLKRGCAADFFSEHYN